MSKLMEQVKEIQRKAHVCPECRGAKKVETHPYGWLMPCDECDGTGELPAPDIDALVGVIEVLAEPWVAYMEMIEHMRGCRDCQKGRCCKEKFDFSVPFDDASYESKVLVQRGLPEEGGHV